MTFIVILACLLAVALFGLYLFSILSGLKKEIREAMKYYRAALEEKDKAIVALRERLEAGDKLLKDVEAIKNAYREKESALGALSGSDMFDKSLELLHGAAARKPDKP